MHRSPNDLIRLAVITPILRQKVTAVCEAVLMQSFLFSLSAPFDCSVARSTLSTIDGFGALAKNVSTNASIAAVRIKQLHRCLLHLPQLLKAHD
jgi:hypothetical protein